VDVVASQTTAFAISKEGHLYVWGDNCLKSFLAPGVEVLDSPVLIREIADKYVVDKVTHNGVFVRAMNSHTKQQEILTLR